MQYNLNYWILQTLAMTLTALLIPKLRIDGPIGAFIMVIALGFVNAHLWDVALFYSVPNTPTVQTATLFLANGIIFWILVKVLPGIEVEGFLPALIAPIVFTFCSMIIAKYATPENITFATEKFMEIVGIAKGFVTAK